MKSLVIYITLALSFFMLLTSCGNDGSTYPSVQLNFVSAQTGKTGKITGFTTDKGRYYSVSVDKSSATYSADTLIRIVATYELQPSDKDSVAVVYSSAATVSTIPVKTSRFTNGIKTDPAEILSAWIGKDYLNIVLNVLSQSKTHRFAFVEQSISTGSDGRNVVSILLYHDSNNDVQAFTQRAYLSIPLKQYTDATNRGVVVIFSLYTNEGTLKEYTFDYQPQ
jgi:hypothetical protein